MQTQHFHNTDQVRAYKVTFNNADIFLHTVARKLANDNPYDFDYIDLEKDNSLTITEDQLSYVQKFGDGIATMTYIGKLFNHKSHGQEEKEK